MDRRARRPLRWTPMLMRHFVVGLRARAAGVALACVLACVPGTSDSTGTTGTSAETGASSSSAQTGGSSSAASEPTTGSSGAASSGTASSGATGGTGGPGVSFTEIYESILVPKGCIAGYCHGGMAGGLEMTDEATAYANLVEVDAIAAVCGLSVRVVPGAPEESILWRRVRPAALDAGDMCAPKMPKDSMGLEDPDAQLVYDWIAAGALE